MRAHHLIGLCLFALSALVGGVLLLYLRPHPSLFAQDMFAVRDRAPGALETHALVGGVGLLLLAVPPLRGRRRGRSLAASLGFLIVLGALAWTGLALGDLARAGHGISREGLAPMFWTHAALLPLAGVALLPLLWRRAGEAEVDDAGPTRAATSEPERST